MNSKECGWGVGERLQQFHTDRAGGKREVFCWGRSPLRLKAGLRPLWQHAVSWVRSGGVTKDLCLLYFAFPSPSMLACAGVRSGCQPPPSQSLADLLWSMSDLRHASGAGEAGQRPCGANQHGHPGVRRSGVRALQLRLSPRCSLAAGEAGDLGPGRYRDRVGGAAGLHAVRMAGWLESEVLAAVGSCRESCSSARIRSCSRWRRKVGYLSVWPTGRLWSTPWCREGVAFTSSFPTRSSLPCSTGEDRNALGSLFSTLKMYSILDLGESVGARFAS